MNNVNSIYTLEEWKLMGEINLTEAQQNIELNQKILSTQYKIYKKSGKLEQYKTYLRLKERISFQKKILFCEKYIFYNIA